MVLDCMRRYFPTAISVDDFMARVEVRQCSGLMQSVGLSEVFVVFCGARC